MKISRSIITACASLLAIGLTNSAAWGDQGADPVYLRANESHTTADSSSQSWATAPPKIHEVGNWVSMAEAQSGLPQGLYAGAELFFARASVNAPGTFGIGTGFTSGADIEVTVQNFTFDYEASPKAYLGWRSAETGDAVQFSYWHYDNIANQDFTITQPNQAFILLGGLDDGGDPFFSPGDTISSFASLRFNVYDIEYFKSLAFAGGRWLVTGSAGVRIADVEQRVQTAVNGVDFDGNLVSAQEGKNTGFTGAGPRLTLEGRRNFGPWFSMYARGGYSILVGAVQANAYAQDFERGFNLNAVNNSNGTVTVADIEFGASWQASSFLLLSAGYQFQSWQGLNRNVGSSAVTAGSDFVTFDGFVARAIFTY